jgi:serine/threonine-protein kinase CHEK2
VGDPALELIDRMLTVDSEERITIDECLEHPWTTGHDMGPAGESIMSTDGQLAGRMGALDFSKRKPKRERTLLSELNSIHVSKIVATDHDSTQKQRPPVIVYAKNKGMEEEAEGGAENGTGASGKRFLAMGQAGDECLFAEDANSNYGPRLDLS